MSDQLSRRTALKGLGAGGVTGLSSTAGCLGLVTGGGSATIKVASKRFTEQEVLGHIALQALKKNSDLNVKDETGLGGTVQNYKAVNSGQTDLYWEYTGTAWMTLPPKHDEVITDASKLYQLVKKEFKKEHNLTFLNRAPFNNTYVLIANPNWVEKTGVKTISDFAEYVRNGHTDFTIVMDAEFSERDDGWPGLAKHYNFNDVRSKLNVRTVSAGLTYQIVGSGEAAVGMGFNTNPKILKFNLEVLKDDQSFFPVYNPAPLVNGKTLDNHPEIRDTLNPVAPKLSTNQIRNLNRRVAIGGKSPSTVAKNFLKKEGLI